MVLFNYSTKELTAKVVYYGPALCGKTTNLQWIHEKLPIKNKGKMLSLATETDRTLFFDFLPIEIGAIRGMRTRIQLYTVPGQVFYNATRRMVLKGADAVVFVCDSQEPMLEANQESFDNLGQNLEANEIDPGEIPIVLQYNKRDLPNALPIEILNERFNSRGFPFYEAVAVNGVGVEETLKAVTKLVFKSLSQRYGDGSMGGATPSRSPTGSRSPLPGDSPAAGGPLVLSTGELFGDLALTPGPNPVDAPAVAPPRAPVPPVSRPAPRAAPLAAPVTPAPPPLAPDFATTLPKRRQDPTLPTPLRHADIMEPAKPGLRGHPPHRTLVTQSGDLDELRRRLAAPQPPPDEEIDLEEIEELDAPMDDDSSETIAPVPPPPLPEPPRAGSAEIEVPLEIHVAPGTTKINLKLKLVLNLKQR